MIKKILWGIAIGLIVVFSFVGVVLNVKGCATTPVLSNMPSKNVRNASKYDYGLRQ